MNKKIYLASPHMSDEGYEREYVKEAFDTNWIAPLGENVNKFEEELAKYVGTKQKILVEGESKNNPEMLTGRTDSNKVVIFEGDKDLINKIIDLKIVSEHMWYLKGELFLRTGEKR